LFVLLCVFRKKLNSFIANQMTQTFLYLNEKMSNHCTTSFDSRRLILVRLTLCNIFGYSPFRSLSHIWFIGLECLLDPLFLFFPSFYVFRSYLFLSLLSSVPYSVFFLAQFYVMLFFPLFVFPSFFPMSFFLFLPSFIRLSPLSLSRSFLHLTFVKKLFSLSFHASVYVVPLSLFLYSGLRKTDLLSFSLFLFSNFICNES